MTNRSFAVTLLVSAAAIGALVGIGTAPSAAPLRAAALSNAKTVAVAAGVTRSRPPQDGDAWGGCNDARAMGTAPIYRDEPGYREDMDGDGDGIACEPVR